MAFKLGDGEALLDYILDKYPKALKKVDTMLTIGYKTIGEKLVEEYGSEAATHIMLGGWIITNTRIMKNSFSGDMFTRISMAREMMNYALDNLQFSKEEVEEANNNESADK